MSKKDPAEIIKSQVYQKVQAALEACTEHIFPDVYGRALAAKLKKAELKLFERHSQTLIESMFVTEVKKQIRIGSIDNSDPDQPDLFSENLMDQWMHGAESKQHVKYGDAFWIDHYQARESQIKHVTRVTARLAKDEKRRAQLTKAGMPDDKKMTTRQAVEKLGLL